MSEFKYDDFRKYEKKNYAKLEFLTIEAEIAPLVDRGISAKAIYEYYKAQSKLTMCYQTFAKYMRKKYGSTKLAKPSSAAPVATSVPQNTPQPAAREKTEVSPSSENVSGLGLKMNSLKHPNTPDPNLI
ncbi:MAG: TraK family protein [Deltaproteobacteria bacterium]|jgi:hypothetical protein|nr:TraK family protein [Deltaproteobacteria bacterium]